MKRTFNFAIFALLFSAAFLNAQQARPLLRPAAGDIQTATGSVGDYKTDIEVLHEAQMQALEQARQMLEQGENPRNQEALKAAINEMERAQAALAAAKNSPDKLPAAIAAGQAAYQALLKAAPREYRMTNSRNGNQGGNAGQASRRQLSQLDMQREENRYETERQAATPQTAQQREQTQTANRLKELAQRQQDLNDRLRELQTALQAAKTDEEREEIQRQLKRLQEEQRQMLASVDEMQQRLEQSSNAAEQAETRQQLEQTRTDMERAAQEMERQSASGALAAGTRAQERMQNLRDDLRRQSSSQFSEQMRELRNEARELERQQEQIARELDSLNSGRQSLDDSAERRQIAEQMNRQQDALTNLLSGMREVTEQAEATEPLLSKQLYDTLRRADQARTDNVLEMGAQLAQRGFLPQASQAERVARTNIMELTRSIERAAESVLGSETEALRFAQRELDDLARQVERELAGDGTNAVTSAGGDSRESRTNATARADDDSAGNESRSAADNSQDQQNREGNPSTAGQGENRGEQANAGEQGDRGDGRQQLGDGNANQSARSPGRQPGGQVQNNGNANGGGNADSLREFVQQLGQNNANRNAGRPITGNEYVNWSDRLRDVEQTLNSQDLRNELATVRERMGVMRAGFRDRGLVPDNVAIQKQILAPLSQVRVWVQEELARMEKSDSLVPLDRDPVPENYSDLVRKYYEQLGSAK